MVKGAAFLHIRNYYIIQNVDMSIAKFEIFPLK